MKKRICALLLGLSMAVSLLPQPIRAASPVDYMPPQPDFGVAFNLRVPPVEGRLTLSEDGRTATLFAPNTTRESGWKDADKNWGNDASLCWAASCSNLLSWYVQLAEQQGYLTPGVYENDHDRIFDQFRSSWPAMAGQDPVVGLSWYFTGGFPAGGPPDIDPPKPHSGGFLRALYPDCDMWSKLNFMQPAHYLYGDYSASYPFLDSEDGSYYDYQPLYNHRSFSDTVIRQLHYGPTCLTVGKENAGPQTTHAVTMWGCDYDEETHLVTAIYLTDSDDSQDLLRRIKIKARPGDTGGILMQGFYPMVGGDQREFTSILCSDLLLPYQSVYFGETEPTTIQLNETALTLQKADSFRLIASVTPSGHTVSWSSSASGVASVSPDGLVTAHAAGQATITATTDDGQSAACIVTVKPTEVSSVTISREELTLTRKDTFKLTASVSPADADNQNITWKSDAPGIASVSPDGLVTAQSVGEARITATAENGQSAVCVVTVKPVEVASVNISKDNLTLTRKDTFKLTASVSPADADNQNITWKSDAPGIASVSPDGLVTAQSVGEARITAAAENGQSAVCVVTVKPIDASSVIISREELTLTRKDTFKLTASVSPADADNQNITWKSDAPGIASVSPDGLVTAQSVGEARITATAENGKSATCVVTVEPVEVASVTISRNNLTLTRKDTFKLSASVAPADADNQNIAWKSNAPEIASVSPDGLVTAQSVGEARITATAENGQSAVCVVTVKPIEVASVTISRENLTLTKKDTFKLTASVSPADADNQNITWKSDAPEIASVSPDGLVTAHAIGQARITATAENGRSASCLVTVISPFVDVPESAYYSAPVLWAVDAGITDGTDETHFSPEAPCTRKQIVTFLWRSAGSPAPASAHNPFVDVPHDSFEQAILWAVEKGITDGVDPTHFSPNAACTRAQAMTFLWRSVGSPRTAGSAFDDVAADAFYAPAVRWAVENGVSDGTSSGRFSPEWICSRAQIVTFLYRMSAI